MTNSLKRTRLAMRESNALGELVSMRPSERPVVFYAEDSFSFVQLRGYAEELLRRHAIPIRYVTSDPEDALFKSAPAGMSVHYVDRQLPRLMSSLKSGLLVMTMPDLGSFHVTAPEGARTLYFFHSLNSVHTSYRSGAFDQYDVIACTGPHHVRELSALRLQRRLPPASLAEVGYHKLDQIAAEYQQFEHHGRLTQTILLAPSWAPHNLLEAHGEQLIGELASHGFNVVVRPHPQFFHSLYPSGKQIVQELVTKFDGNDRVSFELSIENQDSFYSSDLMISDWSGAAFEYALGTSRPAMFIDTPQKIFNDDWGGIGLPAFEAAMRAEVGRVVAPNELGSVGRLAESMVTESSSMAAHLSELRSSLTFNPGTSAQVGADLISALI